MELLDFSFDPVLGRATMAFSEFECRILRRLLSSELASLDFSDPSDENYYNTLSSLLCRFKLVLKDV